MPLLLYLPFTTFISFLFGLFFILNKARGKELKFNLLYVLMCGTGIVFSLIEYVLLFNKYGWDESILKEKMVIFILAVVLNSLNCLGKGIVVYKEYSKKDTDYTGITGKLNVFDPICLIFLIVVVLVFK